MTFLIGVDLGQAHDYTAVAVLEQVIRGDPEGRRWHYECRHLQRLTLGTTYPAIVRQLVDLSARPELLSTPEFDVWKSLLDGERFGKPTYVPRDRRPKLVVDATGVGRPVLDMLRAATLAPIAVTIHGGDSVSYDRGWRVPKRDLVSAMQVLLQSSRFRVASALPFARILTDELLRFRVKIDALTAHDSYGVWREGGHDDLVLACAVACWYGERSKPSDAESRDPEGFKRVFR